jgi:tetratricopeptide (TPR) repeat protein
MKAALATILILVAVGCDRSPEARRNKFIAKGKAYLQKQDYSRAILEFKNAVQVPPADAEAYYQLGVAYLSTEDVRAAFLSFWKSLEINPKHLKSQIKYSQLVALTDEKGALQDAQKRLTGLLQNSTANIEALNTLAFTDLRLGNSESAIRLLEQVLSQSPGELSAALMLAQTKMNQKDPKGAEAVLRKVSEDTPKVADAHRYLAEFYINQVRMGEAEVELRKALELDAKSGPALMDLARLQMTMGRKGEAEQSFKQLAGYAGYEPIYAIFLFDEGRRDNALLEFEKLSKQNPSDRAARTRLVVAYRSMNRLDDAKRVIQQALKSNPHDAEALMQRGEILLGEGKFPEAEDDLNHVLKSMPASAEVHYLLAKLNQARGNVLTYRQELFAALQLNPALLPVRLELAQSMIDNKEGRTALSLLDEAPPAFKTSIPFEIQRNWTLWALGDMAEMRKGIDLALTQARSPDILIQDGLWKLRANNPAGARASLEEALKMNPADLRALQGLRQTYLAQKDPAGALQKVKEYAARQPKSAPVQDFLGILLMANGNRTEARTAFTTAKEADPKFTGADLSLVQMDAAEGKADAARSRLEVILKSNGSNLTARRWLGNLEEMRGNHDAAINHFRQVVANDPNDAQASNNLAFLLLEYHNDNDMALKFAEKAVALNPTTPEFCDTLGWVLYRKGVYNTAIQYLEQAGAHPENVVWKYHLAMAYAKAGNTQRGRAVLNAALKVDANVPEAKIATQLLEGTK